LEAIYLNHEELIREIERGRVEHAAYDAQRKGPPPHVRLGPLTQSVLNGARWKEQDQYPAFQVYADECEALLEFAKAQGQFDRYFADLTASRRQRDAALGELRVAYHLDQNGFEIVQWKPVGLAPKEGEYLIRGPSGVETFVEVKGPSWQSELSDEEIKAGRTKQPKDLYLDGRAIAPWKAIQFAVDKAYGKLAACVPNLLVIADDLFVSLQHGTEMMASMALYEKHYQARFTVPDYQRLGGAGVFWMEPSGGRVRYEMKLFLNPFAVAAPLPEDLAKAFNGQVLTSPVR
jgi:hypothetical protein